MNTVQLQTGYNITPVNNKNSLQKTVQNSFLKTEATDISAETYRAYALSRPVFKGVNQINDISLILTEQKSNPRICVEVINNNKFESKIGVPAVYELALHDQLYDDIRRIPDLKDEKSQVLDYKRRFDISCSEENLITALKMIQDRFINVNIEERYIDKAKNLAPVGYELHTLKVESIGNYNDAPSGMTTKEYEQKIADISRDDIQKYCTDILNNSDTRITLSVNKDFYNKHKNEIMPLLEKFYERQ